MFEDISDVRHPAFTGKAILLRMVEGMGYRFHRAVLGIRPEHMTASPVPGGFPMDKLIVHIGHLIQTLQGGFQNTKPAYKEWTIEEVRSGIERLYEITASLEEDDHGRLSSLDPANAFYLLNGPLSDALWHMGQIAVYKRLLKIETPNSGYYKGQRV